MIARRCGDAYLYDQEALAVEHKVSERTVRRRCEQVACDAATRAPLYDPDAAQLVLAAVRPRPARTRHAQAVRRLAIA